MTVFDGDSMAEHEADDRQTQQPCSGRGKNSRDTHKSFIKTDRLQAARKESNDPVAWE